ncbi:hypothetical protein AB0F46_01835 [Streptomyces sp. NPDC026665]|uniref:hypothetical protein n=1 Tax=Streptomyces sp. NPDC026665 TaxID=3154798 RepID=UPI0033F79D88
MRRDVRLRIITEAIEGVIPGAVPAFTTVQVAERYPSSEATKNAWSGSPRGLAEKVFTALYGRPRPVEGSPLARADAAKGTGDLVGQLAPLLHGDRELTTAPWYPARPGDLVHIHYEQTGESAAFGETYIVGDAVGHGFLSMQLLAHTMTGSAQEIEGMVGCYSSDASDDPLYGVWFEAGPQRLTIVRDGRAVHVGGAR